MTTYEAMVDAVGGALGVDTGIVPETMFEAALVAAQKASTAEGAVDAIGLALGVDTGVCSEPQFDAALEAANRFFA